MKWYFYPDLCYICSHVKLYFWKNIIILIKTIVKLTKPLTKHTILECPEGWFGEECKLSCPDGFYGLVCKETCNCTTDQICDVLEGCVYNTTDGKGYFLILTEDTYITLNKCMAVYFITSF